MKPFHTARAVLIVLGFDELSSALATENLNNLQQIICNGTVAQIVLLTLTQIKPSVILVVLHSAAVENCPVGNGNSRLRQF